MKTNFYGAVYLTKYDIIITHSDLHFLTSARLMGK